MNNLTQSLAFYTRCHVHNQYLLPFLVTVWNWAGARPVCQQGVLSSEFPLNRYDIGPVKQTLPFQVTGRALALFQTVTKRGSWYCYSKYAVNDEQPDTIPGFLYQVPCA